jgi:hypothetical protein
MLERLALRVIAFSQLAMKGLSAAPVDSVWHLCSKIFFNLWILFRTLSADCPWKFCGNSIGQAEAA